MKKSVIFLLLISLYSCETSLEVQNYNRVFLFPEELGEVNQPGENTTTLEGIRLGRFLFYDPILSQNDSITCSSCHKQQFAFADSKPSSLGIRGQLSKFNSPSLSNLAYSGPLNWDGHDANLEEQALSPVVNIHEMDQRLSVMVTKLSADSKYPPLFKAAFGTAEVNRSRVAMALAQFQRSLISNDSKYDKYLRGEGKLLPAEERGMNLFFSRPNRSLNIRGGGCNDCHSSKSFAGSAIDYVGFANNGLDEDELRDGLFGTTGDLYDKGKFKIQTLRNIEVTGPYMRDGRFKDLDEVINHYSESIVGSSTLDQKFLELAYYKNGKYGLHFTDEEKKDLIAFLKSLTDETFLTDPRHSDPFN